MKPKIIAFYLPQYHRTPENDEWWGDGYTDWTAVKAAEKLYEGHNQPRVPMNNNYYNLLEHDTMAWQVELMQNYCIDGMCFYHYWFEKGRRVLEKPAENLLKWDDISMPFCFCWANEAWRKTWSKMKNGNVWSAKYENNNNCTTEEGLLLAQDYGEEHEWEEHLQYLLPFFRDERYIKFDGRPVFGIYRPNDDIILYRMVRYWKQRIKEYGLPGIYFIGMEEDNIGLTATCRRQPVYAIQSYQREHPVASETLKKCLYEELWKRIIDGDMEISGKEQMACAFVDFDTTPRMGEQGYVTEKVSADVFEKYFSVLYRKSLQLSRKAVFVNAWNEWGESNYLEPDQENGFKFLDAIKKVVTDVGEENTSECDIMHGQSFQREIVRLTICNQNLKVHDNLLERWMCLKENGINCASYFAKHSFKTIAVYGIGKIGRHLINELKDTDIEIIYGIDKTKQECQRLPVYALEDELPDVDAVVITVMDQYGEIGDLLDKKIDAEMVPIEEVVYSI